MSCLRIKLPQPKKVWKSFTSKLQTRLHRLHNSKTIRKPDRNRLQTSVPKPTRRPSLLLGIRFSREKRRRALPFSYRRYYVSKSKAVTAPVYVDTLFKEAPLARLVGYIPHQPSEKNGKLVDEATAGAGTSYAGEKQGDDMCDSRSTLASPTLNEIDARAEEFIASFRAEMDRQEIIARNL